MRGLLMGMFAAVALDTTADPTEVACLLEAFDCSLAAEDEIDVPACETGQNDADDAGDDSEHDYIDWGVRLQVLIVGEHLCVEPVAGRGKANVAEEAGVNQE